MMFAAGTGAFERQKSFFGALQTLLRRDIFVMSALFCLGGRREDRFGKLLALYQSFGHIQSMNRTRSLIF